jgi:hypothetical protein
MPPFPNHMKISKGQGLVDTVAGLLGIIRLKEFPHQRHSPYRASKQRWLTQTVRQQPRRSTSTVQVLAPAKLEPPLFVTTRRLDTAARTAPVQRNPLFMRGSFGPNHAHTKPYLSQFSLFFTIVCIYILTKQTINEGPAT